MYERNAQGEFEGHGTLHGANGEVFVGEFQGGAADACIAWKKGELQGVLEKAGLKRGGRNAWKGYAGDPFEFLPKWMSQNPLRDR